MKKIEKKKAKKFNFNLYLPVFILAVAVTILISGTFAWFVDNRHADGSITFAQIALAPGSAFTTTSTVENAIPNAEILEGQVQLSKAPDSNSIIVRARVYFERLPGTSSDGIPDEWIASLNAATHHTVSDATAGYKWTELQNDGYFYLVESGGTGTDIYVIVNDHETVNDTNTYVFLNSLRFPINYTDDEGIVRPITQPEGYTQYQKSLAIKVEIQAIQAEYTGVATVEDAKTLFATSFPSIIPTPNP